MELRANDCRFLLPVIISTIVQIVVVITVIVVVEIFVVDGAGGFSGLFSRQVST